jgi:DNA-binding NarL/FixJ family response regulator
MTDRDQVKTVVLVDDHNLVRTGVRELIEKDGHLRVVGEAGDSATAVSLVAEHKPDVVVLDVEIPGDPVTTTVTRIRRLSPGTGIVVLSMHDNPHLLRELVALGIRGYLLKSVTFEELISALEGACRPDGRVLLSISSESLTAMESGRASVSSREREVLELVGQAMTNSQIANRLGLSEATVKRHLFNIFGKLGAVSRIDAVNKAVAASLITSPEPVRDPGRQTGGRRHH